LKKLIFWLLLPIRVILVTAGIVMFLVPFMILFDLVLLVFNPMKLDVMNDVEMIGQVWYDIIMIK